MPAVIPSPTSLLFADIVSPDGAECRMVQLSFRPVVETEDEEEEEVDEADEDQPFALFEDGDGEAEYLVVCVARSRSELDTLLFSLYGVILGVDLLLLGAIAVLVRRSVSKSLQPLSDINSQVASIGADALHNRVRVRAPPEELRTIVQAINELLNRVERAFERERQFSSDVAHELRTPVSELKTACEVGRRWPDNPETIRQFFSDVREIAAQMEGVVSNLLVLARCDEGTVTIETETVPLSPFLKDCWKRVADAASRRNVTVDFQLDDTTAVETDAEKLGIIMHNLLGNAVSHCEAGTVVRVAVSNSPTGVALIVENETNAVSENDLSAMFERFWRKDSARTGTTHSGLGLSIVTALCDLLGIGLVPELSDGNTFRMRLSFGAGNRT